MACMIIKDDYAWLVHVLEIKNIIWLNETEKFWTRIKWDEQDRGDLGGRFTKILS